MIYMIGKTYTNTRGGCCHAIGGKYHLGWLREKVRRSGCSLPVWHQLWLPPTRLHGHLRPRVQPLSSPSLVVTECRSGLGGAGDLHPEQNGARPRNGLVLHHWQHKQRSVQCRPCKPRALCALRQSEQPCHPWLRVPGHCMDDDASQQGAAMFPLCRTVPYKISRIRSSLLANALALAAARQPSRQV